MTAKQQHDFHAKLLRYSTAASLAAAGSLTLVSQALADPEVVYSGPDVTLNPGDGPFDIDFDGNGTPEFNLAVGYGGAYIDAGNMAQSVSFLGVAGGYEMLAYALNPGDPISAAAGNWIRPAYYANLTTSTGTVGYWLDLTGVHYLGVRFQSSDGLHYGWVELTCTDANPGPPQLIVHRYGWDNAPDNGVPAAVRMAGARAQSGLAAVGASLIAAAGAVLAWGRGLFRRKVEV